MVTILQKTIVILVVLLSVARPAICSQTTIQSISIGGNTVFSTREILGWLSSKQSLGFSETVLKGDLHTIMEKYRERGYLDTHLDLVKRGLTADSTMIDLDITIHEERQTLVGSITVSGQKEFSSNDILELFDTKTGSPLDEATLEQDIDALLERYERRGYPFTQCRIDNMERTTGEENDLLGIELTVDEGDRVTINEVRVEGNKETNPSVVVRETRLGVGEVFNPVKVDAIRQRLQRLNIFSAVSEPELYMHKNNGGLLIKVQEGNTNTFDGVIGYIPGSSTGEAGYVTGLASIAMRNLFGTGRKLSFRWQRDERSSQELEVRYVEPWIFSFPANLGGGFFQRQQDTSYVRRVFDLKGELMLSENLSVGLLFGSESIIPSADTTVNRVFKSSTTSIGADVQYDTRDDIYSPTSGARYHTDYQYGKKKTGPIPQAFASSVKQSVIVQRFTLDLDFFASPVARQVLAVSVHGRELRSGHPEEGEMYRLGGMRSLRGYRENQFIGTRMAWSNVEYRFLLARRTFLYGFVDTGYYLRPADDLRLITQTDAFKYGYGIGVQLETGLGNLGVSFALGQGDSFSNAKIHFGLINEF